MTLIKRGKLKIINRTRNVIVSDSTREFKNFFGRFRGLMFSDKADIILTAKRQDITASSIHMMFMHYPIDVIWLDANKVVVDIAKSVAPFSLANHKTWNIYKPRSPAKYVVELGLSDAKDTQIGDILEFV